MEIYVKSTGQTVRVFAKEDGVDVTGNLVRTSDVGSVVDIGKIRKALSDWESQNPDGRDVIVLPEDSYGFAIDGQAYPEALYSCEDFAITRDEDGRIWFSDPDSRIGDVELRKPIKNPDYIKWDDVRGWIYKNGKDLPWKED